MGFYRTDDPLRDFDRWDREQQKQLDKLPICIRCDHHIHQDAVVRIGGKYYCDECLHDMRVEIGGDD